MKNGKLFCTFAFHTVFSDYMLPIVNAAHCKVHSYQDSILESTALWVTLT